MRREAEEVGEFVSFANIGCWEQAKQEVYLLGARAWDPPALSRSSTAL